MKNDVYGEPEIIKSGNVIAKVYTPILSDEERERRFAEFRKATVRMVLSQYERGKNVGKIKANT